MFDLLPTPSSTALPPPEVGQADCLTRVIHLAPGHPLGDLGLESFLPVRRSHPYYSDHVAHPSKLALAFCHDFFRLDVLPHLSVGDVIRIEQRAFTAYRSGRMVRAAGIWHMTGPSSMPPSIVFELLPADYRRRPGFVSLHDLPDLPAAVDLAQTFVASGGYKSLRIRKGEVIEWGENGGRQHWTYRPGDSPAGVYEPRPWPTDPIQGDCLAGFGGRRRV